MLIIIIHYHSILYQLVLLFILLVITRYVHSIHSQWKSKSYECWLHAYDACMITTWRLGSRAPLVAHNYHHHYFLSLREGMSRLFLWFELQVQDNSSYQSIYSKTITTLPNKVGISRGIHVVFKRGRVRMFLFSTKLK